MHRHILFVFEIVIFSALILATRSANYQDVFVDGNIYFTDADCYARMTRARMCAEHPGLIIRHHDFENFPEGTTPHTTAPLDYLIVSLSIPLKPFTAQPIDFAGAMVSPFLGLVGGWFLWWWSGRMKLHYRWVMLILYGISPILVHGTELGRPDHQSLLIVLVTIGVCAEWSLRTDQSRNWSVVSGIAWSMALWVSFYEPLVLFVLLLLFGLTKDRHLLFGSHRRTGWIVFGAIISISLLVERRVPAFAILQSNQLFQNWSRTIGELRHVSPLDRIWFAWAGYMIVVAPILIWQSIAYGSGQPGVAGVSHEALPGTADSARFFLATDFLGAREILRNRRVEWVLGYDWGRVAHNSALLLGIPLPDQPLCRVLDRSPSQGPRFLVLSGQNGTAKLFRFADKL